MRLEDRGHVYNPNLRDLLQLTDMIKAAEAVAKGAYLREESRGTHYRLDYPRQDERWTRYTIYFLYGGSVEAKIRGGQEGAIVIVKIKRVTSMALIGRLTRRRGSAGFHGPRPLIYKEKIDPSLGVLYSCRMGLCGVCSMKINGRPRLACQTPIDEALINSEIAIEP